MQWTTVERHWAAFSAPLMQRFPNLDEDRLITIDADRAALVSEIADREALSHAQADEALRTFLEGPLPADLYATLENEAAVDSARYIPPGEEPLDDDARFGAEDQPEPPMGRRT